MFQLMTLRMFLVIKLRSLKDNLLSGVHDQEEALQAGEKLPPPQNPLNMFLMVEEENHFGYFHLTYLEIC